MHDDDGAGLRLEPLQGNVLHLFKLHLRPFHHWPLGTGPRLGREESLAARVRRFRRDHGHRSRAAGKEQSQHG